MDTNFNSSSNTGFTLFELLIVISLLIIVTAVMVPSFSPLDAQKVEAAASEVASALRYARNEAMRTEQKHGVNIDYATERLAVFKHNVFLPPPTTDSIYHPLTKNRYDITISTNPLTSGVVISNADHPFLYAGLSGRRSSLLFDKNGLPLYLIGTTEYKLATASVSVNYGVHTKTITVAPTTGLISLQ